ncbi:MAG: VCBS repeat-containing protein, partial [Planctomycetota bacterium]|nr:VCBS repeat-containing protein [Planctomycetota bacterium]
RIFLNDGLGFFEEFNPSGFQMPGQEVASGQPGLWCEGTQQTSTTNSNGSNCDIASSALDIDLGDIDGDFDLDILHGARQEEPRMFENRLEENGGVLGFRDITGSAFPSGYTSGDGHYEQEMADLDGDGDLDIYGLNWLVNFGFTDITLRGNGDGTFTGLATLSNSTADDNEGDFLDYDQDGDLDLFVANFSGQDKLYRNSNNGGSSFSLDYVNNGVPGSSSFTGLDADCCDVDGDGDTDILVANDNGARNVFLKNTTQTADTHAPYIPNVEQAADRSAGPEPTVLRAHVYDNAAYYITWYNETWVEVSVNGGSATVIPAMSSQGQIFRVEIPGSLVGTIAYQWFSRDEYGNTGSSAVFTYNVGGGGFSSFCVGDFNTLVGCPCLNEAGNVGAGCENSTSQGALLSATGVASVSADSIVFSGSNLPSGPGLYFQGNNAINGGNGNVFGDGLRCAGGNVKRLQVRFSASGTSQTSVSISNAAGNVSAGSVKRYQLWYRDPSVNAPCQSGFNLTNGIEITWSA